MPIWLQIIFGIVGVLALVMAMQPFIHIIWGGPKIKISKRKEDRENSIYLVYEVMNEPIYKGILKFLRIRREQANDVTACITINYKNNLNNICNYATAYFKLKENEMSERISLAASLFPPRVPVISADKQNGNIQLFDGTFLDLRGDYTIRLDVFAGDIHKKSTDVFTITDKYPYIYWVNL